MNIFYLSRDIQECAQAHCDRHVNKMILESAQLMASVHRLTDPNPDKIPELYRLTHKNHPCAVWARESLDNYEYLFNLCLFLNEEAQYRYGHHKNHLSLEKIMSWPTPNIPTLGFTEPPKCVHDDFKGMDDVVEAYRAYYRRDKADIVTWTKRNKPDWY